jgi:serine/threonine protein phosphatase PrpC
MKKKLILNIGQYSSAGRKSINQDFHGVCIPDEPSLSTKGIAIAIADGISSSDVSQIASETSIKNFLQDYYCTSDAWSVKHSVQRVLKAVNSWLYTQTQQSDRRFDKDKGYICTFSGIVFKSNTAHLFHSGDSRIYKLTGNTLEQLTEDHRRTISAETNYLTRGLGIHHFIELDYRSLQVSEGDVFILATDGVYEYLSGSIIANAIIKGKNNLDLTAKALVEQAYAAGSTDNLTLQIIDITQLPRKNLEEVQGQVHLLPPAPKLQARKSFDGYDIIREIYISSRSHVYLAKDNDSGKKVVLKTPSTEMRNNEEYLENFLMEDWVAKRMNNPHVLTAVEDTRKKNYLYTVTEFIEGKTLAQWMRDNPAPSIDSVRAIIEQVVKGLQAFHRQEMVHQDLRPNNIMIDDVGTVKIIDFGATKVAGISEIIPKNEGIVGTAQFTAPEYFLGQTGTHQSDLFSLGVLTYQMLSGELPYGNEIAKTRTARDQQRLSYRPLSQNKNDIPGWVDYAIKKSVDINPEKRYVEVSEFMHELKYPNPRYMNQTKAPLIERNPVLVWQGIAAILLGIIIYQHIR